MLMPRHVALAAMCAVATVHAHTVDLGKEIAPRACSAVQAESQAVLGQTSRIHYYDGRVPLSVVIIPTQSLPDARPDDVMSTCARRVAEELERARPADSAQPEESFRRLLNGCLADRRAPYQATTVLFRRGPVECGGPAPAPANWLDELRAGLKWCRGKDNVFSRNLCEYRERNRFCAPGNQWGKVAECER